jgi:RNA polymerase sigma-70 factor (ECF subfamily)
VAVHRLRKRFREVIRHEIAETVADEVALAEELRHFVNILRHRA